MLEMCHVALFLLISYVHELNNPGARTRMSTGMTELSLPAPTRIGTRHPLFPVLTYLFSICS